MSTRSRPSSSAAWRRRDDAAVGQSGAQRGADAPRDRLRQLVARAGLAQQLPVERRVAVGVEQLGRVARHQQRPRSSGDARLRLRGQLGAAHPGAERDVAEQQIEAACRPRAASSACSPLGASITLQPQAVEEAPHDRAHLGVVLDQQHRRPGRHRAGRARRRRLPARGASRSRQVERDASCPRRARCRA